MQKQDFFDKVTTRTSDANAQAIADALEKAHLLDRLTFLKDGRSTSVFDIKDSGLVLKLFDRRTRANERIRNSRFQLSDYYRCIVKDHEANGHTPPRATEVVVEIEPKLTDRGLAPIHQEMLRYELWTKEGREFKDILAPASNRHEIKNVMLDHRGVPYQIDEDAVAAFDDPAYPANANGRRSDEQYLAWRADSLNEHGRPDTVSQEKFGQIKSACNACDWPVDQQELFDSCGPFHARGVFTGAGVHS